MKNLQSLIAILMVCFLFSTGDAQAATVVTPASGGTCLNITPGAYKLLSNIIITEGAVGDISVQTGATFILTAPAGTQFLPGNGNVIFTAGRDISSATLVVTATTVTVTLNVPTNTQLDIFRIRNLQARSLIPYSTGNITRTATGGTAIIAGDAAGAGVNHGYLTTAGTGAAITSISNGNWTSGSTWSGGNAPSCGDNVVINHQVTVNNTVGINDITINTGGNLIADNAVTVSGNFAMNGTSTYTHNNSADAPSTIFNGTENFATTSKIIISKWSTFTIPLPTGVTGNFGAIDINITGSWDQAGLFAPARIKGALTINSGAITMDNGTGSTTALTLQNVVITGSGRFIAQSGTARDLTLTTGNFTDISTSTGYSYIMYRSVGNLVWNVNGNLAISHRFMTVEGVAASDIGSASINVTGNYSIGGGTFFGIRNATGPISIAVAGTFNISGSPVLVSFKDNYPGNVTFNSGAMTVNSGASNYFMRGNSSIGTVSVTINGNLNISGNTTRLYVASSSTNSSAVSLHVTNDMLLTGGQLYTATTAGSVSVIVDRHMTQSGTTSQFYGQRNSAATGLSSTSVTGTLSVTGGLYSQSIGLGNIDIDVVEALVIQNATFSGMDNASAGNNGLASLDVTDLNISGSSFYLHKGEITDSRTINVNIANEMSIDFTNAAQRVYFVNRAANNNALLSINIGSNFIVTGTADGLFCSSMSEGAESITIGGDMMISAGRVRFNAFEGATARGHAVTGNLSGNLLISGGSIAMSSNKFAANWNIGGDYDQSGGYAVYKWHTGAMNLTVQGNYSLINGSVYMYSRTSTATPDPVTVTINGNATYENSTTVFDSCQLSTATHKLIFKGDNVTYGTNVLFTHLAHLTSGTVFGSMNFDRAGTINLRRNAASFDIRQVKQTITSGTTVNFATSPFDLMISSHMSSTASTHTTLNIDGTLNMGTLMIAARDQANYYASLNVNAGGRLRTAHTNGLYSGTALPSTIYSQISSNYRMNYFLNATSTVEYNGTNTQIITGIGQGLATTTNHRYGNLEINFQGTADVEFAYPADDFIYVRTSLILTSGELNLDDDHITNTGGRTFNMQNGATISRVNGYIRSETEDGTGAMAWDISTNGSFVIPFGYTSSDYIPFTFQPTSGSSGIIMLATNHVAVDNTPLPPTVTHVNSLVGANNSTFTVDRFWRIVVPGSVTASLTFSSTSLERSGILNPRAQLWEASTNGWFLPSGVQSNPTIATTFASGVSGLNNWWTLSSSSSPLPIELISFDAVTENDKQVRLSWVTASEINNDFFTIERSSDGVNFTSLMNIDGAGNSTSTLEYATYDINPLSGVSYYRLKQTDFDGRTSLSEIKKVNFKKSVPVTVFPNPVMGNVINISTNGGQDMITEVVLYDLAGKLISRMNNLTESFDEGVAEINLGNTLQEGTYVMEVNTVNGIYRERIVKQ